MNKIDESILAGYEDADEYVYINDTDPDLQKWRIKMPKPPEWHLIDGFGLPAREQKFQYEKYPEKLKQLEDDIRSEILRSKKDSDSKDAIERMIYDRKWEVLDFGRDQYADIIKWIKRQWFHRLYGKWYFIKGKPTYLDGWHVFFLNSYKMEGGTDFDGAPEYRDRDRRWFHAQRYLYTTTETIDYDNEGNLVLLDDGTPKMRCTGSRTVLGSSSLKGRRTGESSKGSSIDLELVTSIEEHLSASQADTDANAEGLYNKLKRYSFHKLPFFFTPITPNSKTGKQISLRDTTANNGLQSYVTYRASGEYAYDGSRINFYLGDEIGKTKNADIIKRHYVVARTLTPGIKIRGFMLYVSTAEEMDSDVGKNFEDLTMKSMFEDRGIDGRTQTGLVNVHFSIEESFEGFIDPWGFPIIDNPTDPDVIAHMSFVEKNENGEVMGVREYLKKKEQEFLDREDLVGLSSFQRKNPKSFRECFANISSNLMFNRAKLQTRLLKLKYEGNKCVRGDFVNDGNNIVRFAPNVNGRFNVSMQLSGDRANRMIFDGHSYRPQFNDVFVASADAYRVSKTDSRRKSLGSGAVLYKHDPLIDNPNKPTIEWETKKFVCTYVYRPETLDEYCQDMLNMCVYYGSMMYPEQNLSFVQEYFQRKGFDSFLLRDVDHHGRLRENSGWNTGGRGGAKDKLFNLGADWVNLHSDTCEHPEIIEEFLNIKDLEDMKNRDLFVSVCGALLAEQSTHVDRIRRANSVKVDISGFYPK
jgi:hypothetical protein